MSIDERARHELHRAVEQALGAEPAASLMALLPPVGWAEVATKADLQAQDALLHAEMEALKAELRAETGGLGSELHAEMGALKAELRAELGGATEGLRGELRGEVRGVRGELVGLHGELQAQRYELTALIEERVATLGRTIVLAMIGFVIATWAALAGVVVIR